MREKEPWKKIEDARSERKKGRKQRRLQKGKEVEEREGERERAQKLKIYLPVLC